MLKESAALAARKVLFFPVLHRTNQSAKYLADIRRGADYLRATLPAELKSDSSPPGNLSRDESDRE